MCLYLSKRSGYRVGGQTLRGQFVSGETVSRSFVYINHGKFRIVRPFTRPSRGPPIYDHLASERAIPSTFLRADALWGMAHPPPLVCPYLTAATMLTRLELVTNTSMPLTIGQRFGGRFRNRRTTGRRKRDRSFSLPSRERRMEILRNLFETEFGSLLRATNDRLIRRESAPFIFPNKYMRVIIRKLLNSHFFIANANSILI